MQRLQPCEVRADASGSPKRCRRVAGRYTRAMAGVAAVGFMLAVACIRLAPERRLRRQDDGAVIDEAG